MTTCTSALLRVSDLLRTRAILPYFPIVALLSERASEDLLGHRRRFGPRTSGAWATVGPGVTPIAEVEAAERLQGRRGDPEHPDRPHEGAGSIEATIIDGTGRDGREMAGPVHACRDQRSGRV